MNSTTAALLWQIWWRHRSNIAGVIVLTIVGRTIDFMEVRGSGDDLSPITLLIATFAFLLLLGVLNYTESEGDRALGAFPRRLLALPVTSLRLVTVPLLTGIVSIEVLYLLWREPLARGGSASPLFVAVLFAGLVVFYLWTLWTLERSGSLRLLALGVIAMAVFVVGQLPTFAPSPPPVWRSEWFLASVITVLAMVAFWHSWRHVDRIRCGDVRGDRRVSIGGWTAQFTPTRRRAFATAAAAQFWYEWRLSGLVLPVLVAGILVVGILPMSWSARTSPAETFRVLLMALATPIVLSVPVGMAFCKANFWSEDLTMPAFVAVRPLTCADLVAIKLRVAALSTLLAWAVTLVFTGTWLATWGNLDFAGQFLMQIWAFNEQSLAAVYGSCLLVVCAGIFLTWRALVSRLWSGLSGIRTLYVASVFSIGALFTIALAFEPSTWPGWVLADPARLAPLAWIAATFVIAKYWMAAYSWRTTPAPFVRRYLLIWFAGTASFLAFGMIAWSITRIYVPLDIERSRGLVILLALLAMPIARIGLAPSSLARSRHRA